MHESHRVVWPERGVARVEAFDPGEVGEQQARVRISPGTERAFFLGLPKEKKGEESTPVAGAVA